MILGGEFCCLWIKPGGMFPVSFYAQLSHQLQAETLNSMDRSESSINRVS